jgi:hypothetical protein
VRDQDEDYVAILVQFCEDRHLHHYQRQRNIPTQRLTPQPGLRAQPNLGDLSFQCNFQFFF